MVQMQRSPVCVCLLLLWSHLVVLPTLCPALPCISIQAVTNSDKFWSRYRNRTNFLCSFAFSMLIKPILYTVSPLFMTSLKAGLGIRSFAHFAQIKWAAVSDSLRSLKTNERSWANRLGRSWQMSDREGFTQVAHDKWANERIPQVAHQKWVNERFAHFFERIAHFLEGITHWLIFSQKMSDSLRKPDERVPSPA